MAEQKYLYHYTSRHHLEKIMEDGYLKLTPSNLIKPVDLKIVRYDDGTRGTVSAVSDYVKPVVWMTDSLDASGHGLGDEQHPKFKKSIRITIPMKKSYKWWLTWAEKNRMKKSWFKVFTSGKRYGSWYISEEPIMLDDIYMIEDIETGAIILDNRERLSVK